FGADLAAERLRDAGIAAALVEVGGEIRAYGRKPDGNAWQVLVEAEPDLETPVAQLPPRVLALDDAAVATSGDRWHHFEHDGQRYSHTFDPRTGTPVHQAAAAVTVVAADAMHADAWATALTVMGADEGLRFAEDHGLAARFVGRGTDGAVEAMTLAFRRHLAASVRHQAPTAAHCRGSWSCSRCCSRPRACCCHCMAATGGRHRLRPAVAGSLPCSARPGLPSPWPACEAGGPDRLRSPTPATPCWWPGPARPASPQAWPNAAPPCCAPAAGTSSCCRWTRSTRRAW